MIDLKQRVLAAVAEEPSLSRQEARRRSFVLMALAAVGSVVVFALAGGLRPTGRPLELWGTTSVGAVAIAGVAVSLALRRGRSMLGRSAPVLIGIALATPLLLFLWKLAVSSAFPGMTEIWPDRPGFRCMALAAATGIFPTIAFLYVWRGTAPAHPRLTGMALGATAGGLAWVLVDLWCPVAHVSHLMVGHIFPLVLLAGLGAAAGGLLNPRPLAAHSQKPISR